MGYAVFQKTTGKRTAWHRWDEPPFDSQTHVCLQFASCPAANQRLNVTEDGLRDATPAELDADVDDEKTRASTMVAVDPVVRALALVTLDWINELRTNASLPAKTAQELRQAVKAKL